MKISSSAVLILSITIHASKAFSGISKSSTTFTTSSIIQSLSRRNRIPFASTAMSSSTTTTTTEATMEASTETNPMLDQTDLPKFTSIQPADLTPAVTSLLDKMNQDFSTFESQLSDSTSDSTSSSSSSTTSTTPYNEVLPKLEQMQFPIGYVWGIAGHLNGVKNTPELREAYESNQPKIVQAMSQFSQSRVVYDALSSIQQSWEEESKEEDGTCTDLGQKQRAVENNLRGMMLGGVGLDGAEKERFNEIKLRVAELGTSFSNHVLDSTKAFYLDITDATDLEGVPDSAKAMWAQTYHAAITTTEQETKEGEEASSTTSTTTTGPDANAGPWRISLDGPSYISAMTHLPNRTIREKVYKAFLTRASEQTASTNKEDGTLSTTDDKNNIPLIYEILNLKSERAKLLGFDNFAELSLASKMAPTVQSVQELSELILEKALPAAVKELEEVTEFARMNGGDEYTVEALPKLAPWDITYWSERLKESKYDLKEEELRPYFALPRVLDGMFSLVERLFNIRVEQEMDGSTQVWNDDVTFYKVFDVDSEKHIASFYLDPYSRPADKRGGAWMDVCIGKSEACNREVPVAYLTCNGSPPVGDKPSLMSFREVETMFHEFGHGLQHMLTTATVGDVAGINGVEWDAVELPSQFMENWCYDDKTISGIAKHYETNEPLPDELFQKLKDQKTYGAGMMACRQLYFGLLDMELHSNYDAKAYLDKQDGAESIFDVQTRIASKCIPYNMPIEQDRFLCSFNHIFAGGYSAGYYSYKWAEVMSADAFGAFEDVGLENEEEVKAVGRKFRDTVLSLGGGVDPMTVFKDFRGREPSPEALLRHNGLA